MTTGKTITLTIWTFVSKVMYLIFNTLSRFVITLLRRQEYLSSNFMAAVAIHSDFRTQEEEICHCFHYSPSICYEVMGVDVMILVFLMLSFKPVFHSSISP